MHLNTNGSNTTANPTQKPLTTHDPPKTPPTKRRKYTKTEKSDFKREEATRRNGEDSTPPSKKSKNSTPPTPHANGTTTRKTNTRYQGPYRIVTWNAQGLLAHNTDAQQLRRQHMLKLCNNTDILCMKETHTNSDPYRRRWHHRAGRQPPGQQKQFAGSRHGRGRRTQFTHGRAVV